MNLKFALLLLIFSMAVAQRVISQTDCSFTLRGKVLHDENNEPIESAYIWIDTLEKEP